MEPFGVEHTARTVVHLTRLDRRYLREQGMRGPRLYRLLARGARHHTLRTIGAGLGARVDRLPVRCAPVAVARPAHHVRAARAAGERAGGGP